MLWKRIIASIKWEKSNSQKLKEFNKELNDRLEDSNIFKIEQAFKKELFWTLSKNSSGHITVDSKLFENIKDVSKNLDLIKEDATLDARIKNIKFDTDAIKINDVEIDCTQELSHEDSEDTGKSIENIKNSEQNFTKLEWIITDLELRFEDNIRILGNISEAQQFFENTPRQLNEINEDLSKIASLKNDIWEIMKILSDINNTLQGKSITAWDDSSEDNSWEDTNNEKLNNYLKNYNSKILDIAKAAKIVSFPVIDIVIRDVNDIDEIHKKLDFYSQLSENIDKKTDELNNEKNDELKYEELLRDSINQLKAMKEFTIPNWFLPFWDKDTVAIEWSTRRETDKYIEDFQNRIEKLNNFKKEIKNIRKRYETNEKNLNEIKKLQEFHEAIKTTGLREKEIKSIIAMCESLHLWDDKYNPRVQDQVINAWWSSWEIKLDFMDKSLGNDKSIKYSLCDKEWNSFIYDDDWWRINWKDSKTHFNLKWINFDDDKQTMQIDNLEINPIDSVTFPLDLNLNIKISITDDIDETKKTKLTIDHYKPIHIKINRPRLPKGIPEEVYSWFEADPINKKIEKYSDKDIEDIENEIIRKILYEWWDKSEIDKYKKNKIKGNLLIEKIRNRLVGYLPSTTPKKLKDWFKEDMIRENNRHIPLKYLLNKEKFKEYINENWETCLNDYIENEIYKNISAHRNSILSCFSWPQNLSEGISLKKSKDSNYTKFLVWKNDESKNNECKIDGTTTVKYSVKTEVKWINRIAATIKIGSKEAEIIEASNHDELIERILNRSTTRDGDTVSERLRCDIALSVLKSMIKISPQMINRKTPYQDYLKGSDKITCNRINVLNEGWNLILRACKLSTKNQIEGTVDIFKESEYKDKYDGNSVNELKKWIWGISTEINLVMNSFAKDYQRAIYGRKRALLNYNTDEHFKWSDIKRLWWKLIHGETNNNFNFGTEVNDLAWKKIKISLNKWKFTISWEFEGQDYKYEADNLWTILKKKIKKKRVFDWVELDIISKVNEKYVKLLRTNSLIKNKNFVVSDLGENRTWRIYIFDKYWNLKYFEVWNEWSKLFGNIESGHINFSDIPSEARICGSDEEKDFFKNPILSGKLIKEMRKSLTLVPSLNKVSETRTKLKNRTKSFREMSIKNKFRYLWSRFKKSTAKLFGKIYEKKAPRYSVDIKNIGDIVTSTKTDPNFKVDYNTTDTKYIEYKMKWDLEFTADYLNWKISAKKYLKSLGVYLDGDSNEEIETEANRRADMYKKYLKENKKS